jgi:hypothetical protein
VVRRITSQDFERIVLPTLSRLDPVRIEAVRRVMVDGVRWREAAAVPGVAMSALSKAVAKGWRVVDAACQSGQTPSVEVLTRAGLPDGWVAVHLVVPASVLPRLRDIIGLATADLQREHARKMASLANPSEDKTQ